MRQAEAILRFTEEVDRRLAEHGISGVDDFLERYAQFQRALAAVTQTELEWASGEMGRLVRVLQRMGSELQHLTALKSALDLHH